ncbi:hypothetical protein C9374_001542 [Naegleria lovaniensis]|uniref:Uncharacterized protein n=1 Tax=Naegleria lovaniensis TaxID=51637 RepID=A0AA88GUM0_NAELO|nr:uncharacterized protein C9374_001542 [Naegleria lovaniensis]KAG2387210.1 hypothetical protein C9374_001542 [Naegleria lovaniensis]
MDRCNVKRVNNWKEPLIQPFGKQFVMVTEEMTNFKTFFSIYDLSDLGDIQRYPISEIHNKKSLPNHQDHSTGTSTTTLGVSVELKHLILDWETPLLASRQPQLATEENFRAFARMIKTLSARRRSGEKYVFEDFPKLKSMEEPYEKTSVDDELTCFVGGRALFIEAHLRYSIPKIEVVIDVKKTSKNNDLEQKNEMQIQPLNGFQIPQSFHPNDDGTRSTRFETCHSVILPCENIQETNFALNAILFGGLLYRYELTRGEFDPSTPITFKDETWTKCFNLKQDFPNKGPQWIPYLENGKRLRSFIVQDGKLFEFIWKDQNKSISVVQHLEWLSTDITLVKRCDHFGLLIRCSEQCLFYIPEACSPTLAFSKSLGRVYSLNHLLDVLKTYPLFWSDASKCLCTLKTELPLNTNLADDQPMFVPLLTQSEIEKQPFQLVKDLFHEEEFKKEFEYCSYDQQQKFEVKWERLEKVSDLEEKFKTRVRIPFGYQCPVKKYNDMEIIAGIGCLNFKDQLGEALSSNYMELEPHEFSQFLGAPIMFNEERRSLSYRYFILDMKNCRKSSGVIEIANAEKNSYGTSGIDLNRIREKKKRFVGILAPKKEIVQDDLDTAANEELLKELALAQKRHEEFEKLSCQQLFQVESHSLRVCDPFVDPSGVLIENVKPGLWKWIQYSPNSEVPPAERNEQQDHMDETENQNPSHNENEEENQDSNDMSFSESPFAHQSCIHQLAVIHQDFTEQLLHSNPEQFWKVPKEIYQHAENNDDSDDSDNEDNEQTLPRDFRPQAYEGGWFVMTCGIGVDVGLAGIFDSACYNNSNIVKEYNLIRPHKLSTLEQHFNMDRMTDWQRFIMEYLEKHEGVNRVPVPFGIISSSGYGDGCYACLFKRDLESKQVVAVRVIFIDEQFEQHEEEEGELDEMESLEQSDSHEEQDDFSE